MVERHIKECAPFRALWLAVLERAAVDYAIGLSTDLPPYTKEKYKDGVLTQEMWVDLCNWFASDSEHHGSFVWVCDMADIEPDRFRAVLTGNWERFLPENRRRVLRESERGYIRRSNGKQPKQGEAEVRSRVQCTTRTEEEPRGPQRRQARCDRGGCGQEG